MTITTGQIAVSDVENELRGYAGWQVGFDWLNANVKAGIRPGSPNLNSFKGLAFYQRNADGNCTNNGANCDYNCNCNCGNIQCNNCANCSAVNCANCDGQAWLQSNCNCACTYNCNSDQNCFSYNCNCSKIICTKLYEYGLMPRDIFEADQAFGEKLIETNPDIYNGYRAWAEIVVQWMEGKGPKMMPWMSDEEFSVAAKNWSTTWAQDIATPWAEEMAYMMGAKPEGSLTGKMMFAFGIPICKVIGVWQRWFGPSKKEAGFLKGAGLVVIFVMFKLIAEAGRFIERFIPKKEVV